MRAESNEYFAGVGLNDEAERQHLVVPVQVGDVVDLHAQPALIDRLDVARRLLERAEMAAEDDLLVVVERVGSGDQGRKPIHPRFDSRDLFGTGRLTHIDAGYLANETGASGVGGLDGKAHRIVLPRKLKPRGTGPVGVSPPPRALPIK